MPGQHRRRLQGHARRYHAPAVCLADDALAPYDRRVAAPSRALDVDANANSDGRHDHEARDAFPWLRAPSAPWWPDGVLLAVVAAVIRIPAYFASAPLTFDDGNYGATARVLRDGAMPFRDAFVSQGPGHAVLLWLGDLLGGRTLDSPRLASVLSGVVVTLALWHVARRLAPRHVALLVGFVVATTGTLVWVAGPSTSDGPAAALAALGLVATLSWCDRPSAGRAALIGVCFGLVVAIKALAVLAAIPIVVVLIARRRWAHLAIVVASSAAALFALSLPFGLRHVWTQSVTYHTSVPRLRSLGDQLHTIATTAPTRDAALVLLVVAGFAYAFRRRRGGGETDEQKDRGPVAVVAAWALLVLVLLAFEANLWTNHLALLVVPLAVLLALRPPPARVVAPLLVVGLAIQLTQLDGVLWNTAPSGSTAAAIADLRALPRAARVVTDEPGLVWRAGRRTTPWTDDGSILRILSRSYSTDRVLAEAGRPEVCAALVWSYRFGAALPGFEARLGTLGYAPARTYDEWTRDLDRPASIASLPRQGPRRLWTRPCAVLVGSSTR